MDHRTFFSHYLPALQEALHHDHEWDTFLVKGPDYFYAGNEQLARVLEAFIVDHCDTIPLFDRVGLYFDCLSHCFDAIDGVKVQAYKEMIIEEANGIKQRFDLP